MSKEIDKALGLTDIEELEDKEESGQLVPHEKPRTLAGQIDEYSDSDYMYTRQSLYDIIEKGEEGLDHVLELAKVSQDSKDFEAFSKLIKSVVEANKELSVLSREKRKEFADTVDPAIGGRKAPAHHSTQNIFVGTTKDLNDLIHKDDKVIEHDE